MAQTPTLAAPATRATAGDRVLPATRVLAIFIIPFLIVASAILYFYPADSGRLFAWPIKPPVMAMALASAYAGGIYYFARVVAARQWHMIKAGFLPVATFASLLGIATILHWDRFTHGHIAFDAWAGLYFTTPFLVIGAWLYNRPADSGMPAAGERLLPPPARWLLGAMGAATLVISAALFLNPGLMIGMWPWALTPLTARVLSAMYALPGVLGLELAADPRWSAAKVMLEAQAVSLILILIGIVRTWSSFDRSRIEFWVLLVGISAPVLGIALLYWLMERRPAPAAAPARP